MDEGMMTAREALREEPGALPVKKIRVRLSCGYTAELDEDCMDDQELLDDLIAFDQNHALYTRVLKRLLGDEGLKELYECCRAGGRVRASLVVAAMMELVTQLKNGKK